MNVLKGSVDPTRGGVVDEATFLFLLANWHRGVCNFVYARCKCALGWTMIEYGQPGRFVKLQTIDNHLVAESQKGP